MLIRRSRRATRKGRGRRWPIPRGYRLRPVEAVQTWLAAAEISSGPGVPGGGARREGSRRGAGGRQRGADREALRPAGRAWIPPSYAGHSLRSGFLTSAAESGASIWKLSEVSRHKSLDTLRGYVRRVDLFKEHAGAAFL